MAATEQAQIAAEVTPPTDPRPVTLAAQNNSSGYGRHGASWSKTRLRGWFAPQGSPDKDATDNVPDLRARSRDLIYGTPLAAGAIKRLVDNVIGTGLRLNSQIDAAALGIEPEEARQWEADTEREWLLWASSKDSDAGRTLTFAGTQRQAFHSQLVNGDVFVMLPIIDRPLQQCSTRTYLIEGDRVA
ncbi:MAG: phage portal protein, partial [Planctomycetota bacterium]|nr:phage portal protein [Planctomycetota bacterium]